jgi:hypothetical protein
MLYCYWLNNENFHGLLGLIKSLQANKTLVVFDIYNMYLSEEIMLALLYLAKSNVNYLDFGLCILYLILLTVDFKEISHKIILQQIEEVLQNNISLFNRKKLFPLMPQIRNISQDAYFYFN